MLASQIEGAFWFSVVWSLGANLDGPSRAVFNTFLRRLMSGKLQVRHRSISFCFRSFFFLSLAPIFQVFSQFLCFVLAIYGLFFWIGF